MKNNKTIFVSIASYRDEMCQTTLEYIFKNAENPKNIYVGVCQQNNLNSNEKYDKTCYINDYGNNIRLMTIDYREAKGPTWARYLCSTLYKNEDYFFQIDSHTKLIKNWDSKLISMIEFLKDSGVEYPVLSHYPNLYEPLKDSFEDKNEDRYNGVTRICKSFFNDEGMISFHGAEVITTSDFAPTSYVAGGFLFADGHIVKNVPFDPTLDYLFTGEEILHSIRIWTSGYDIYTPNENIAFHEYTRPDVPKIWTDQEYSDTDAINKVKILIGLESKSKELINYKYGLGNKRTLQQYYDFAGIDIKNKKINKNFCKIGIETFNNTNSQENGFLFIFIIIIFLIFIYSFNN